MAEPRQLDNELIDMPLRIERLQQSLDLLEGATREPQPVSQDRPVFVASIGWRSGSTLTQRVLMSDPTILVWGEPMAQLGIIERLRELLYGISEDWPAPEHWLSHREQVDLARDWVATLSPDAGHLKAGYRAFLDHWLAIPARQRGFERWGAKQVRWSGQDGLLLRWLYPECRFIVVVRHPASAYLSMRNYGFDPPAYGHLVKWPDDWILSLDDYARFWNRLTLSWHFVASKIGAHWVRYEDLIEGRTDIGQLGATLGLALHPATALSAKTGGSSYKVGLAPAERDRINTLTASGRRYLAYDD